MPSLLDLPVGLIAFLLGIGVGAVGTWMILVHVVRHYRRQAKRAALDAKGARALLREAHDRAWQAQEELTNVLNTFGWQAIPDDMPEMDLPDSHEAEVVQRWLADD